MDKLLEEYPMVANLSDIQPFQRLRDTLGFYTSEAARAHWSAAEYRGQRAALRKAIADRKTVLMRSKKSGPKWRAELDIRDDPTIAKCEDKIAFAEVMIDMLETLRDNYWKYVDALSREQTAREKDLSLWKGRAGQGK